MEGAVVRTRALQTRWQQPRSGLTCRYGTERTDQEERDHGFMTGLTGENTSLPPSVSQSPSPHLPTPIVLRTSRKEVEVVYREWRETNTTRP